MRRRFGGDCTVAPVPGAVETTTEQCGDTDPDQMSNEDVRIAVAGAGLMGRQHITAIGNADGVCLAALIDPAPEGRALAEQLGVAWFADLASLPDGAADGVILATPNQTHVADGLACVARGLPVLVEKPLATTVDDARRLVEAAEAAGVPLLVGHHRRHNPLIAAAKQLIDSGGIGRIVSVHGMFWLKKPDDYFDVEWRRQPGAGPVLINLIHDIDLLRFLVGEIVAVQAVESSAVRGHPVEDTAVILFEFESGALGTFNASDAIPSPWSWEFTAAENPVYDPTDQAAYLIGGTEGSLEVPSLRVWRHADGGAWHDPIAVESLPHGRGEPLVRQVENFAAVISQVADPVVPGREGLRSLAVVEAVKKSSLGRVRLEPAP